MTEREKRKAFYGSFFFLENWIEDRLIARHIARGKERYGKKILIISRNYNSKKEDLEEEDQRQDERNVIL